MITACEQVFGTPHGGSFKPVGFELHADVCDFEWRLLHDEQRLGCPCE
jgi:hypothetical protein